MFLLLFLGVILPAETKKFSFIFKAMSPGIFSESWEFGTQPVLLGGAVLQVTLWGIAVYEDITVGIRDELQVIKSSGEGALDVLHRLGPDSAHSEPHCSPWQSLWI